MTMIRKLIRAEFNQLGDDEVEVVMSTAALARDGHVLVPQGCQLENYRANPIVLWSHDPDKPIGNAEDTVVSGDTITARVRFAPTGISHKADEIRGLTKAGVIRAVSVGFDPIDAEPLDPKKPKGGLRIMKWELLELSFVSVPADTGAVVTARAHGDTSMPGEIDTTAGAAGAATAPIIRANRMGGQRNVIVIGQRGLYQVAQLCYMFESLGYQVDMAKYESAIEGDASKVPGMLVGVLHDFGEALLAMAEEEIAEALAGHDVEPDEDDGDIVLTTDERAHISAAGTPLVRAWRRGVAHAKVRAGKSLSAETVRCLRAAQDCHDEAIKMHRSAIAKHKEGMAAVGDLMDRAGVSDPADDTTQTVQKSDGTSVDEGSRSSETMRRRDLDMLSLSITH